VDTTGLDKRLRDALPVEATGGRVAVQRGPRRWVGQVSAAAACLALIFTLMSVTLQGRPVQASPNVMAQMHEDIVSGKVPTMKAGSIEEANRAIAAMGGGSGGGDSLRLPEVPNSHTMACCMRTIGNKKVACVLLENGGKPVTMSVAEAKDVTAPQTFDEAVSEGGETYYVVAVQGGGGKLRMVTCRKGEMWVCLISEAEARELVGLASRLKR
jgi:hypothetical protein